MSAKELIESGLLELYVLGACSADELALINQLSQTHPEVVAEIERIEKSLQNYAAAAAPPLRSEIKATILNKVQPAPEDTRLISLKTNYDTKLKLYKFALAASLLLFISSIIYTLLLQQKLGDLSERFAQLDASKSYLVQEIKIKEASISSINQRLQVITNPGIKSVTLNGMNSLLNKYAMVYWNSQSEEVYFNAAGLPDCSPGKQYQLWAIVNGKPVNAGIVDLATGENLFQKMKKIKGAAAFAVTIEKLGGSENPTLETMCLLGNV